MVQCDQSYSEAAAGQTSCLQTAAAAIPAPGNCVQTCCVVLHTANIIICHMSEHAACFIPKSPVYPVMIFPSPAV